jgi:hypothetical protein
MDQRQEGTEMSFDEREAGNWGYEDGLNAAIDEITAIIVEFFAAGDHETATQIHNVVWQRLRDRQEPLLAERKARQAKRDAAFAQRVAEIRATQS